MCIQIAVYLFVFTCMSEYVLCSCWVGKQTPLSMGVCEFMRTYLCVLLRGPPAL